LAATTPLFFAVAPPRKEKSTEEVRATIPTERLLVFDVAEGWAPLCRFLDVPVPDTPFPHMNSTEQFWKTVRGQPH
jgi:hypothetical protein